MSFVSTGRVDAARWAISAIFFMNGAGVGLWAAHIPIVRSRLELDERMLGWVLLAMGGAAMISMPLAAAGIGRFGTRRAAAFMAFAFAVAVPLPILAPTTLALFAAAVIFGACNGGLDVSMNAHASDVEAARGRPTMSSFHGFFSLGGLAGAALGGSLIGAGWGNGGGAAVAVAFGLLALIPAVLNLLPGVHVASSAGHFGWPRRAALTLGILALLAMGVEGAVADWSALLLTEHTGSSAAFAATGYAAFSIVMAACRFAGDSLISRFGARNMMIAGGILIALGLVSSATIPHPLLAAAGFALVGLGAANVVPVIFSAAARLPGLPPGAGVAAVASVGYAGLLMGPPLIGGVASLTGLATALGLLSLAGLAIVAGAGAVDGRAAD
ncbi:MULTISPECIES: MFS transporter [Rhodomicrobium]|uniref:MFS transporter n=1 Tax=Rhodomicrobium TaxID=1068 RepID=UPI000B4BCFD9|nr:MULTISPECIES: MFS transporter [Rhodomicrobium]